MREPLGIALDLVGHELHQETEHEARARLGDDAFVAAADDGRTPTPEEALAVALRAGH